MDVDTVRVAVRSRPAFGTELGERSIIELARDGKGLVVDDGGEVKRPFSFDHVFVSPPSQATHALATQQRVVYKTLGRPLVQHVLAGYNTSIFAYGATGTGKSFTMLGELTDPTDDGGGRAGADVVRADADAVDDDGSALGLPILAGVIPRLCFDLFSAVRARRSVVCEMLRRE
jgi:hypothetical protein